MRVIIAAGGTGGHLFPAIRLAEEILLKGSEPFILTSSRMQDSNILENKNIKFFTLPIKNLRSKGIISVLDFLFYLTLGTIRSAILLFRIKPSYVVGFGGYVSGPVLLLACLFRIKTMIHEQNVYPGKTNKILARFVGRVAISFPETRKHLKCSQKKIIFSGNILRKEILLLKDLEKKEDIFKVLIMGGSQGSSALNRFLPEAIGLMGEEKKRSLELVHISGAKDRESVAKNYKEKGIKSRVLSFTEAIDKLYNECDFVVARAGATTISELMHLGKPAILVPYPYGDRHQIHNAKVLEKIGSGVIIEEKSITTRKLVDILTGFMDRGRLNDMSKKAGIVSNDASRILVEEILR
ncbi:MAG: undecaprenyldiphospho-muramoylpentapeptide beta-N-acetylglucosaminyltransferase [Candidatus Omnitrophota bacterium]